MEALKRSIYISVYRVLEHMSLNAIQKLYLVTQDGRVLGLDSGEEIPEEAEGLNNFGISNLLGLGCFASICCVL